MADTDRQTAGGKGSGTSRLSLDGFVAGPNHAMDWMTSFSFRPGLIEQYAETTGAVLGGLDGWDGFLGARVIYGGAWSGPASRALAPAPFTHDLRWSLNTWYTYSVCST
jgi:hypothetical protein